MYRNEGVWCTNLVGFWPAVMVQAETIENIPLTVRGMLGTLCLLIRLHWL
jgi:hypothetical protein